MYAPRELFKISVCNARKKSCRVWGFFAHKAASCKNWFLTFMNLCNSDYGNQITLVYLEDSVTCLKVDGKAENKFESILVIVSI